MFAKKLMFVGLAATFVLSTRPAHGEDRLENLERAVRQLQQHNAELESEMQQLKSRRDPFAPILAQSDGKATADNKTVVTEPTPSPVYVQAGGIEYKLTLGGFIQTNFETGDVSAFEGRFGATALKDRFRLRRARISLTGDFTDQFDFKIEGDFEQSDAAITVKTVNPLTGVTTTVTNSSRTEFSGTDIFVNWHRLPEMNLKIGQYKAPFGLEQLTPDTQIYTIERSLPTGALTPERQIGVMLWGKPLANILPGQKDLVTYYAGAFNGNGRNINNNDNNEFMYVGRLELLPFKGKLMGQEASLKLGGDYLSSRDDAGTNISPTSNLQVNPDGSLTSYTLPSAAERRAWSVDTSLKLGPFDFVAEYFDENVDGRTVLGIAPKFADFNPHGWYVQGSYFAIPKKLQAVVKWEELSPDQLPDDGIHSLTGGLNYYIHGDSIKVMADYVHTWSDYRHANPHFGADQFNEVLLRMQVMF